MTLRVVGLDLAKQDEARKRLLDHHNIDLGAFDLDILINEWSFVSGTAPEPPVAA